MSRRYSRKSSSGDGSLAVVGLLLLVVALPAYGVKLIIDGCLRHEKDTLFAGIIMTIIGFAIIAALKLH